MNWDEGSHVFGHREEATEVMVTNCQVVGSTTASPYPSAWSPPLPLGKAWRVNSVFADYNALLSLQPKLCNENTMRHPKGPRPDERIEESIKAPVATSRSRGPANILVLLDMGERFSG
ncbi:hypothetical protein F2P81_010138 [Scophthalmus maximus]|uniref:Uncharacterized protein n=1 Tax=Scophthalmus maximus TaxID=52904 RepID=A0A6A4T219_SCOMX|nr:hypothetical protein F2P81_010138 [Scophthalmus maximus]